MGSRRGDAPCFTSSSDFADAIFAAKRIRPAAGTLRVVAPLAIDDEPVFVRSRCQRHRRFPHAVLLALEQDWILLPVGEVTEE